MAAFNVVQVFPLDTVAEKVYNSPSISANAGRIVSVLLFKF